MNFYYYLSGYCIHRLRGLVFFPQPIAVLLQYVYTVDCQGDKKTVCIALYCPNLSGLSADGTFVPLEQGLHC